MVNADLLRGGKTERILTDPEGNETVYALDVGYSSYEISRSGES